MPHSMPDCEIRSAHEVDLTVVAFVLRAGAQLERWTMPKELTERQDVDASPITHDDLIDFHEALAALPTVRIR